METFIQNLFTDLISTSAKFLSRQNIYNIVNSRFDTHTSWPSFNKRVNSLVILIRPPKALLAFVFRYAKHLSNKPPTKETSQSHKNVLKHCK